MSIDLISDVLRAVRLDAAFFYKVVAREPWCVETGDRPASAGGILPQSEHLIPYHVLVEGRCWGGVPGAPLREMHSGDVIVLPRGGPQRMASDPTVWPAQRHVELPASERLPFEITIGGDGPVVATFVCGFLGCDRRPFNPLLDALPPVVVVRGGQGSWLSTFGQQALLEADMKRSGGELMVTRLAELMFIEVVRRYVETLPPEEPGWLAGMRDGVVGKALALLHTSPAHAWTLDSLARAVSCSRTVLAERFSEMVKEPPMRYLTRWRMQLAAGRLSGSTVKLSEIAGDLGYDSEEAFSRAFKRVVGASPGEWRSSREFPRTREVLKKENAPRDGSSSRTRGQRKFARERDG